jgi:hypothetical protein
VSDTIVVPVTLGTFNQPAIISGVAFELTFTSELVDTLMMSFDSSMLQPGTARIDFDYTDFPGSRSHVATTMTNHQVITSTGNIVNLIIVMEGNIAGKTDILQDTLIICPDRVIAIDHLGHVLPVYGQCDSLIVYDLDSRIPAPPLKDFHIYPIHQMAHS